LYGSKQRRNQRQLEEHDPVTQPTTRNVPRIGKALGYAGTIAVLLLGLLSAQPQARAQTMFAARPIDFGMSYIQERAKFVGSSSSDYFYLRGAKVDVTVGLWHGLGASITGAGLAATNLRGDIDVEHVQFLVGPRYTYNLGHISDTMWGRRGGAFVEGKVGYTMGISGEYPINGIVENHASGLTYEGGAGINFTIYHRFDLRLIEGGLERTQLPNGGSNVQNTVWLGSGINFHFGQ
jgi:hypothetical protein